MMNVEKNDKKGIASIFAIYEENLNTDLNSVLNIVGVITGNNPRKTLFGKILPVKEQFKHCLRKYGPEILLYPCKPNEEDYRNSPKPGMDDSVQVDPKISGYTQIENELNAKIENGKKFLIKGEKSFPLTADLNPTHFSHSTLFDYIIANANIAEHNNCAQCLEGFFELYNKNPKFQEIFQYACMAQAFEGASAGTRQYAVKVCHDLAEFSNKAFAEETALAHKSVEELMLESNRTFAERADPWEMLLEQGKRRRAYELWLKQGGQPKPILAGDLFNTGKTPTIIHDYTISHDRPKLNPEDPIDEKQREELLKALKEVKPILDHLVEGNHDHTLSEGIKPIYKYHGGDHLKDFTASNSDFKTPKPILKPISKEVLKHRLELYFKPQESSNQTIEQNFLEAKKQLDPSSSEEQVEQNKSAKEAPTKPNEGEGK